MNARILSGSALKIIAVVSMLCDHVAKFILSSYRFAWKPLLTISGTKINLCFLMTSVIGRIAFPLFAFLIVEGYIHTRDLRKYVLNLLVFGVLAIAPWNLLHGDILNFHSFNVLFTFLSGILAIYGIDHFKGWKAFLCVSAALALSYMMKTDYSIMGVLLIILFHAFRNRREYQSLSLLACLFRGKKVIGIPLAALFILLYNGKRGFIKGKVWKYAFYAFYPLHLLVIYLIRVAVGIA